jgi:hypothetical protein
MALVPGGWMNIYSSHSSDRGSVLEFASILEDNGEREPLKLW